MFYNRGTSWNIHRWWFFLPGAWTEFWSCKPGKPETTRDLDPPGTETGPDQKNVNIFYRKFVIYKIMTTFASDLKSNLININIMFEKFTFYLGLNDQTTKRQEIETVNASWCVVGSSPALWALSSSVNN